MHACMHVCMYECVCMCVCLFVCLFACLLICLSGGILEGIGSHHMLSGMCEIVAEPFRLPR